MISLGSLGFSDGLWTPVIRGSSVAGSQTYSAQLGTYTRIGNRVIADFRVVMTALDGATAGNVQIAGLPFAAASSPSGMGWSGTCGSITLVTHAAFTQFGIRISSGDQVIGLFEFGLDSATAASALVTAGALQANTSMVGSISYLV